MFKHEVYVDVFTKIEALDMDSFHLTRSIFHSMAVGINNN